MVAVNEEIVQFHAKLGATRVPLGLRRVRKRRDSQADPFALGNFSHPVESFIFQFDVLDEDRVCFSVEIGHPLEF